MKGDSPTSCGVTQHSLHSHFGSRSNRVRFRAPHIGTVARSPAEFKMAAAGLPGDLPEEMINAMVPKKYMTSTPEKEPCDYPQPIIEKWHSRLVCCCLAKEVELIIKLAFTRPRLLCIVMTRRKRLAGLDRLQRARRRNKDRMSLHRANQRSMGIVPPPRPWPKAKAKARAAAQAAPGPRLAWDVAPPTMLDLEDGCADKVPQHVL